MKYLYKGQIVTADSKEEAKKIVADNKVLTDKDKKELIKMGFEIDDECAEFTSKDFQIRYHKKSGQTFIKGFSPEFRGNLKIIVSSIANLKKVLDICKRKCRTFILK